MLTEETGAGDEGVGTAPRPLFDSPLRNIGGNTVATKDAFGQPRILGGYADVGAIEYVE